MKNIFVIVFLLLFSCEEYPLYRLGTQKFVPDSLKEKQRTFVIETVRAASNQMTAGDYEDPEDVIEQAYETSEDIYSIDQLGMYVYSCQDCNGQFIPATMFTAKQKIMYNRLINGK